MEFETSRDLFWEIKRLLFIKEMTEIGIFKFFNLFSKMWKTEKRYNTDKIRNRAELCLTPTLTSKREEEKLFQGYFAFLSTR